MKTKIFIAVLLVIAIGLCIGLISVKNQAEEQHKQYADQIAIASNQLSETSLKLEEQKQTNLNLTNDLAARRDDIAKYSNSLTEVKGNLAKTEADLAAQKAETAKRDARIADLEAQTNALDKQAIDLKTSIGNLETQITDTQKKLDAAQGDKAFLQGELKRLIAEKTELENRFQDLVVLRAQVKKLKDELSLSRRLQWIREGVFARENEKGAQRLMQGEGSQPVVASVGPAPPPGTNALDLNVEVNSDGSVKVIAPLANPPATTSPPPAK
jgi:chromosome segregation ATPase